MGTVGVAQVKNMGFDLFISGDRGLVGGLVDG